jgi:hypothetical protein
MYVLYVFALIDATNTFACLEYIQIYTIRVNIDEDTRMYIHQIRAVYIQIHQIIFACILMYMHV